MTGTKIVKLKLEGVGSGEKLPTIKEDPLLEYHMLFEKAPYDGNTEIFYADMLRELDRNGLSQKEIQAIVDKIPDTRETDSTLRRQYYEKVGLFMSALVEGSKDHEVKVKIRRPFNYVGFRMGENKKLTVEGNLGDHTAFGLDGGDLTIVGNTEDNTAIYMRCGSLNIKGNTGKNIGCSMVTGAINVSGNAGDNVGDRIHGGLIDVGGSIGKIGTPVDGSVEGYVGPDRYGEIRHKGVRVAP
ncbi:MAG: hypothetical protein V1921_06600 [Candidatus Altiarchaeota archaeon]